MHFWGTHFVTSRPVRGLPELMLVGCESRDSVDYYFKGNAHADHIHCCFQYTLSGEGVFRNAEGESRVPAGTGFVMEVSNPSVEFFYPADATEPWKFIYAQFQGGSAKEAVHEFTRLYGAIYSLPQNASIIEKLQGYRVNDGATIALDALDSAVIVNELLVELGRSARDEDKNEDHSALVREALPIIRADMRNNINASILAEKLDVSREHLSRVFRSELRMSPYAFIIDQRMQQACHLLLTSSDSNKEIAEKIGFGSDVHFSQLFKKKIGMTPKEFRKMGVPLNRSV